MTEIKIEQLIKNYETSIEPIIPMLKDLQKKSDVILRSHMEQINKILNSSQVSKSLEELTDANYHETLKMLSDSIAESSRQATEILSSTVKEFENFQNFLAMRSDPSTYLRLGSVPRYYPIENLEPLERK